LGERIYIFARAFRKKQVMMKKRIGLGIGLFLIAMSVVAQNNDSVKTRPLQVTFAYPLGSNGIQSMQYANNFSLNILYGLNGGVKGAEIGSIFNYNRGKVTGGQISGVANVNRGNSTGFLLSGIANVCLDSTAGIFISGVVNYSGKKARGVQLSTVNIAVREFKGFQLGTINYAGANSTGFQLSTVNIATGDFKGFQLGVVNYAQKLHGVQLGVVNYVNDGEKTLPIGLVSIARKNGYFEFELAGGEAIYGSLNYKMGVRRFYTIYKLGFSAFNNRFIYSLGLGFGTCISIAERHKLNIDLSTNNIRYNLNWNNELNLLNKLDVNYKFYVSKKFSLLIGPSFNLYVAEEKLDGKFGTLQVPYSIFTHEWTTGKLSSWIGVNAGVALKL
jgi:hypothetical protein